MAALCQVIYLAASCLSETRGVEDQKTECFLRVSGQAADLDAVEEIIQDSKDFDLKAWDPRFVEEIPRELRESMAVCRTESRTESESMPVSRTESMTESRSESMIEMMTEMMTESWIESMPVTRTEPFSSLSLSLSLSFSLSLSLSFPLFHSVY